MTDIASLGFDHDGGLVVARIAGEVDLSNSSSLQRRILQAVPNTAVGLVVDLSEVTYLDSSGIRMLGELAQRLRWREQRLTVVAPDGSRVRGVLTMAGADEVVPFEATLEAARKAVLEGSGDDDV